MRVHFWFKSALLLAVLGGALVLSTQWHPSWDSPPRMNPELRSVAAPHEVAVVAAVTDPVQTRGSDETLSGLIARINTVLAQDRHDDALLSAFVDLSIWVRSAGPDERVELLDILEGNAQETLACILILSLVFDPSDQTEAQLAEWCMAVDDNRAVVALWAAIARDSRAMEPADEERSRSFWRGACFNLDIGETINPGFTEREKRSGRIMPSHCVVPPTVWTQFGVEPDNLYLCGLLKRVAVEGRANRVRLRALGLLSSSQEKDDLIRRMLASSSVNGSLRAVAYEEMRASAANWSVFAAAIQRERDPRILAGLCTMLHVSATASTRETTVRLLEGVIPFVGTDPQLADRLTTALSLSDTADGVASLERIARTGDSEYLRCSAVRALMHCSVESEVTELRVRTLGSLVVDQDQTVAAHACCAMFDAAAQGRMRGLVSALCDSVVVRRAAELVNSPSLPTQLRGQLTKELHSYEQSK